MLQNGITVASHICLFCNRLWRDSKTQLEILKGFSQCQCTLTWGGWALLYLKGLGSFPKKWLAPTVRFQGSQRGNVVTSENGTSNSKHNVGHSTAPASQMPLFSLWEGKRFCLSKGGGGVGRCRKEGDKKMMREEWTEISISWVLPVLHKMELVFTVVAWRWLPQPGLPLAGSLPLGLATLPPYSLPHSWAHGCRGWDSLLQKRAHPASIWAFLHNCQEIEEAIRNENVKEQVTWVSLSQFPFKKFHQLRLPQMDE